jgi:hypothetical protein
VYEGLNPVAVCKNRAQPGGTVVFRFGPGSNDISLLALLMEAARTSETSVDIQLKTRQYIPEDSELRDIYL